MATRNLKLIHHGIVKVDEGSRDPGLYWLRLWHGAGIYIAVVTEIPGNPGLSVTNGISLIRCQLLRDYKIDAEKLILFEIWPPGVLEALGPRYYRVDFVPSPTWTEMSFADIERAVGSPVPTLPLHDELYAQVLDAGGGISQPVYRRIFQAVPVEDVPAPHRPASCQYYAHFLELEKEFGNSCDRLAFQELEIGQRFLERISTFDRSRCRYHRANWLAIADESVRIFTQFGVVDVEAYIREAESSHLGKKDRWWLVSLFSDPIDIGGGSFTNGQHRACAVRFSGAKRAAMVVGHEHLGDEEIIWTYKGGG